jgi:hypothetical protein
MEKTMPFGFAHTNIGEHGRELGPRRNRGCGRERSGEVGLHCSTDQPDEQRTATFGGCWGRKGAIGRATRPAHFKDLR